MAADAVLRGAGADADDSGTLGIAIERRMAATMWELDAAVPTARRDMVFRRALVVADIAAVAVVSGVVLHAVIGPLRALVLAALVVLVAKVMGLYDRDEALICKRTLDDAPRLFHLVTFVVLATWLAQSAVGPATMDPQDTVLLWGLLLVDMVLFRAAGRTLAHAIAPLERCLVIADESARHRVSDKLERDPRLRSSVVAHLPLVERRFGSSEPPHAALERAVRALGIHRVIVAPDGAEPGVVLDVVSRSKALGVNVSVLPRICEVVGSAVEFDDLGGMTLVGVRTVRLGRSTLFVKRAMDLVGASLALVLAAPVMAVIAVAVKLDSRGPVLFRQTRVGREGQTFSILKFRTMVDGAHAARPLLAARSNGNGLFKLPDDPRVTRVGRFLRRTSLDELPQLVNVLAGTMSLVGPRPLVVEEDQLVVGHHRRRLNLKPGLTGPWQILGSAEVRVGVEEMATIDYLYVAHWSVWDDFQVMLRTIAYMARRSGV